MRARLLPLAAVIVLAGCAPDAPTTPGAALSFAQHGHSAPADPLASSLDAATQARLAQLRAATARFHDIAAARAAGWSTQVTGCMSNPPLGGMGFHYADLSRFDAVVEETRPEILVYAPKPGGGLQLVAVEYAVPLTAWTAPEPPSAFGRAFHVNEAFGLWVLHAWVWQPNPSGVFSDWNPRVACPGD